MTLPPLTLLDFMGDALRIMREREQRDAGRRAEQQEREARERAAEQKHLQELEERRLAELEQQRQEAEERLRQEEAEKQRQEAEERLKQEQEQERQRQAEERRKAKEEERRLKQEAQAEAWSNALKAIAEELAEYLRVKVGASYWAELTVNERQDAVRAVEEAADVPLSKKAGMEKQVNKKRSSNKKLRGDDLQSAVLTRVKDEGKKLANDLAVTLQKIAEPRVAERQAQDQEDARRTTPVTVRQLNRLAGAPKPSGELLEPLYQALLQGNVELVHNDSYRTKFEKDAKSGNQYGPFSRSYGVRIYGTDPSDPGYYKWCTWVVHVHFKTSKDPMLVAYAHLKSRAEEKDSINHVMNKSLDRYLIPIVQKTGLDARHDKKVGL